MRRKYRWFFHSFGDLGLPLLLAAIVLFLAAMLMMARNVALLGKSYADVERSNEALLAIAEINTQVVGIDLSVRGYALTGKSVFAGYFSNRVERMNAALDTLDTAFTGEPKAIADVAELRKRVTAQEQLFSRLLQLGPGHAAEVADTISDPAKREKRYAVERQLMLLQSKQAGLLAQRRAAVVHQASRTYLIGTILGGFALIVGSFGFALAILHRRATTAAPRGSAAAIAQ